MKKPSCRRVKVFLNGEPSRSNLWPRVEIDGFSAEAKFSVWIIDGGIRHFPDFSGNSADVHWIGDGDSASAGDIDKLRSQLNNVGSTLETHRLPCDKAASDFAVALDLIAEECSSEKQFVVELYGAQGGRFDHALITFKEAVKWVADRSGNATIIADFGVITNQPVSVFLKNGDTFSVINSVNDSAKAGVQISGARYGGKIKLIRPSSGLSNVVLDSPINFFPLSGTAVLLWNLNGI